jgi:transposase, IS5 family
MSLDLASMGQLSLLEEGRWRSIISVEPDHRLVVLCKSIPWLEVMQKARPILYEEQGIAWDTGGRKLNLRAHLGAYILQTVHGWTDRWTEEMVRFYFPARIFCGYLDSTGSLDHTKIEEFRNRFGEKGAQLITHDMLKIAKEFGFTEPTDVDMDTTVQEAGITHPTEMKLMNHLIKRLAAISGKLKAVCGRGIQGVKSLSQEFRKVITHYRFFAKDIVTKTGLIERAKGLSEQGLEKLGHFLPGQNAFDKLQKRAQDEILRLLTLGPQLMDQIGYWLRCGKVAPEKIIALWKFIPKAIPKGKIGKPVEFGRKWIVNAYRGGYVLVHAPENPKIADQHCVIESLSLHKTVFDEMPSSYGTDQGMYSNDNLELCLSAGIKKIAIQPKGKAQPLVSRQDHQKLKNRRVAVEARIAHLKLKGLGKSRMKTDLGDLISGYRSALACNLGHLMRDLAHKPETVAQ